MNLNAIIICIEKYNTIVAIIKYKEETDYLLVHPNNVRRLVKLFPIEN